jgi:hypothetical protein
VPHSILGLSTQHLLAGAPPMPRRLRIQYEGAIDHVMARGNARQDIVHDDDDRRRTLGLVELSGLEAL